MNANVKRTLLITFLLFSMLIVSTYEQRGRSRSRSRSSFSGSRSRSRSSSFRSGSFFGRSGSSSSQNCTTINGTRTCTPSNQTQGGSIIWGIIIVVGAIGYYCSNSIIYLFNSIFNKQNQQRIGGNQSSLSSNITETRRKVVIKSKMDQFQAEIEQWPSILDEATKQAMVQAFSNRTYQMNILVKNQKEAFNCEFNVSSIQKITEVKYEVALRGKDQVGSSWLNGLFIFRDNGFALKLSKVYDNREAADQVGQFDVLLYEGTGNPDYFGGFWAFAGFENKADYSGTWEATSKNKYN